MEKPTFSALFAGVVLKREDLVKVAENPDKLEELRLTDEQKAYIVEVLDDALEAAQEQVTFDAFGGRQNSCSTPYYNPFDSSKKQLEWEVEMGMYHLYDNVFGEEYKRLWEQRWT